MKVVLDTNVFISGIYWSGPPSIIVDAWRHNQFSLAMTLDIFKEYQRVGQVLSKKYSDPDAQMLIDLVPMKSDFYRPYKLPRQICSDPDDDKFIECGLAANADHIVTGDRALLAVNGFADLNIVKPREFVDSALLH